MKRCRYYFIQTIWFDNSSIWQPYKDDVLIHAYDIHAYDIHAYDIHAYDIHAYDIHAYDIHAPII